MRSSGQGAGPSEWLKRLLLQEETSSRQMASGIFMTPFVGDPAGRLAGMLGALSSAGLRHELDWQYVFVLTGGWAGGHTGGPEGL